MIRGGGFKSSLGMNDRVLDLTVDGEQWSDIKKVVPLSPGDSTLFRAIFLRASWLLGGHILHEVNLTLKH